MMDKKVIMWIEDEPESSGTDMRIKMLEAKGYKVELVTTVTEALNRLKATRFDLILLDIMMPPQEIFSYDDVKGGYETGLGLMRYIKKQQIDIPIIVVTGYPDNKTERECISEFSIQYYLHKPLSQIELEEAIEKSIG